MQASNSFVLEAYRIDREEATLPSGSLLASDEDTVYNPALLQVTALLLNRRTLGAFYHHRLDLRNEVSLPCAT